MKVFRKPAQFTPISIVLETQKDADLFISIIDKIDMKHCNAGTPPRITKDEYAIVRHISNAFNNMVGMRD